MTSPDWWNPAQAVSIFPVVKWQGVAWRAHNRRYEATDHGGSLLVSGRYHRAQDRFSDTGTFPALYLALGPEVALGEILRHLRPERLAMLNDYRISEVHVSAQAVLDVRDVHSIGMSPDVLWNDTDYAVTQSLAFECVSRGLEGMIVPSATRLGDNLILFVAQLQADSRLRVVSSRDPRLYVPRD